MPREQSSRSYRKEDVEEFDRKLRRFHESLAHKERRMLREIIAAALAEEDVDVSGFLEAEDEHLFAALRAALEARAAPVP
jgi:hypothetical protein